VNVTVRPLLEITSASGTSRWDKTGVKGEEAAVAGTGDAAVGQKRRLEPSAEPDSAKRPRTGSSARDELEAAIKEAEKRFEELEQGLP